MYFQVFNIAYNLIGDVNSPVDNCCRNVIDLSGGCETLLETLDSYKQHEVILTIALEVLKNMTRSDEINKKLGDLGIVSRVVSIFKEYTCSSLPSAGFAITGEFAYLVAIIISYKCLCLYLKHGYSCVT